MINYLLVLLVLITFY